MEYQIQVKELIIEKNKMTLTVMGSIADPSINSHFLSNPKLIMHFDNGKEDRRIPFVLSNVTHIDGKVFFSSEKPLQIGDYVQIRITDTLDYDLLGEVIA